MLRFCWCCWFINDKSLRSPFYIGEIAGETFLAVENCAVNETKSEANASLRKFPKLLWIRLNYANLEFREAWGNASFDFFPRKLSHPSRRAPIESDVRGASRCLRKQFDSSLNCTLVWNLQGFVIRIYEFAGRNWIRWKPTKMWVCLEVSPQYTLSFL